MEKLKTFLGELGFGKNEIDVYTALLGLGESTVLQIYKKVGIHRSNIYEALESLIKKGLVSNIENPVKKYYARDPKCLLSFIKSKEMEYGQVSEELKNTITIRNENKVGKTHGNLAFKDALFSLLELKGPIYAYGIKEDPNETLSLTFDLFHRERIKRKIKMRLIYHAGKQGLINEMNKIKRRGFTEAKNLPIDQSSKITTFICYNKVVIINWADFTIIEILDKEIADSYAKYFDILWQSAK